MATAKDEYIELMQHIKFYGNMRFAILTVFIAFTVGLLNIVLKSESPLPPFTNLLFNVGGIIVTIIFWISEESSSFMWKHFAKRAVELEQKLDYQIYSTLPDAPKFRIMPTTYALRFLYGVVFMFWFASIIIL